MSEVRAHYPKVIITKLHNLQVRTVEDDLEALKNASNQADLLETMKRFGASAKDVLEQSGRRQQELMDPALRDELAAARNGILFFIRV